MPRKPILAAASIVIASAAGAGAHVSEDEILTDALSEDSLIQLGETILPTDADLLFSSEPLDHGQEIGIDYAQTYYGGSGDDGVIQGPTKTPNLQGRVQTRQPKVQQPTLQTQPSGQIGQKKPRKLGPRKKRRRN